MKMFAALMVLLVGSNAMAFDFECRTFRIGKYNYLSDSDGSRMVSLGATPGGVPGGSNEETKEITNDLVLNAGLRVSLELTGNTDMILKHRILRIIVKDVFTGKERSAEGSAGGMVGYNAPEIQINCYTQPWNGTDGVN